MTQSIKEKIEAAVYEIDMNTSLNCRAGIRAAVMLGLQLGFEAGRESTQEFYCEGCGTLELSYSSFEALRKEIEE